jgi:hypothetical protein
MCILYYLYKLTTNEEYLSESFFSAHGISPTFAVLIGPGHKLLVKIYNPLVFLKVSEIESESPLRPCWLLKVIYLCHISVLVLLKRKLRWRACELLDI